ncbi:MAG: hypothetical protein AAB214_05900 [Fibrobacterota bacterium]
MKRDPPSESPDNFWRLAPRVSGAVLPVGKTAGSMSESVVGDAGGMSHGAMAFAIRPVRPGVGVHRRWRSGSDRFWNG